MNFSIPSNSLNKSHFLRCFTEKWLAVCLTVLMTSQWAHAQSFQLTINSENLTPVPVFSSVSTFDITIDVAAPLAAGTFSNPPLNGVQYNVTGSLAAGTPSQSEAFELRRDIAGDEFYAQGSSLSFSISQTAVLIDGVQIAELIDNAREVGNGRFHPPILTLNANGTGTIQNTDNVPDSMTQTVVPTGAEYITNLTFDPGNVTIVSSSNTTSGSSGGGTLGWASLLLLSGVFMCRRFCGNRLEP